MPYAKRKTHVEGIGRNAVAVFDDSGKLRGVFAQEADADFHIAMRERFVGQAMVQLWSNAYQSALAGGASQSVASEAADKSIELAIGGHVADVVARAINQLNAEGADTL